ncbi:hypothetical protein EYF80_047468 [Liparis tanakae]|uniref:Uncharacterized protein n=1 Tax=Liparis tanakae TaxID=230148 RepID=A0A4Z2FNN4_9TELE|nr:hypothetical protein EYF80_047468 [Liparis tanakae]
MAAAHRRVCVPRGAAINTRPDFSASMRSIRLMDLAGGHTANGISSLRVLPAALLRSLPSERRSVLILS